MCMGSCRAWPQMLGTPTTSIHGTRTPPPPPPLSPQISCCFIGIVINKQSLGSWFVHTKAQASRVCRCAMAFMQAGESRLLLY